MDPQPVALVTNVFEYGGPGSAEALAEAGYRVAVHDVRFAEARTRESYAGEHPGTIAFAEQDPEALAAAVLDRMGRVDVLVSNDVIHATGVRFEDTSTEDLRAILEKGMVWPWILAKAFQPGMKERRRGAMIFITSGTAIRPASGAVAYGAARAGAANFAMGLAKELGRYNIQVNAIGPNWFKSETYFPDDFERSDFVQNALKREVPLQRLGRQDEMGALVVLLASQKAMPITGQMIAFGAGYYP